MNFNDGRLEQAQAWESTFGAILIHLRKIYDEINELHPDGSTGEFLAVSTIECAAQRISELESQVSPKWSDQLPTKPGFYWQRYQETASRSYNRKIIMEIRLVEETLCVGAIDTPHDGSIGLIALDRFGGCEWAGPIPFPVS